MIEEFKIGNTIQSVNPPETGFGYNYWSHMIPPVKPKDVLMLGYGEGTVGKLIKKIWGDDVRIVGVDIHEPKRENAPDEFLRMPADVYLRAAHPYKFDFVAVDIFEGENIPKFVFSNEFVAHLRSRVIGRLAINIWKKHQEMMDEYRALFHIERIKVCDEGGNNLVYFML